MSQFQEKILKFGRCPACRKNFHFYLYKEVVELWAENMKAGKPIYRKETKGKDNDYLEIHYYICDSRINVMLKEVVLSEGKDIVNHHIFFYLDKNFQIRGLGFKNDDEIMKVLQNLNKNKISKDQIPVLVGAIIWDDFLQAYSL